MGARAGWRLAITALALIAALPGCRETQHCTIPGTSYQNGQCLPRDGGGIDAAIDVGIDASADAFDVCSTCTDGSVCFDGEWDGGDAHQLPGCVECVRDEQCAGRTFGGPDGGGADAGPARGRALCDHFTCVLGCTLDTDCGTNGVCLADHRCSAYPRYATGNAAACYPCDTDRNCPSGLGCVPFEFVDGAIRHAGNYCMIEAATCSATTRPLSRSLGMVTSVDGHVGNFCRPVTSCQALLDTAAQRPCSTTTDGCGYPDSVDATCSTTTHVCTIACANGGDCPGITACTGDFVCLAP